MSTTTHTPGPWEIRPTSRAGNGTGWRDIVSAGSAFDPTYVGEALEQDAALIAAAPDLLAALKACRDIIAQNRALTLCQGSEWVYLAGRIGAAIAKAEGR